MNSLNYLVLLELFNAGASAITCIRVNIYDTAAEVFVGNISRCRKKIFKSYGKWVYFVIRSFWGGYNIKCLLVDFFRLH